MHYKIIGVNEMDPASPTIYIGQFDKREGGEHPIMTALATQFGDDPAKSANESLKQWSGGEVDYWETDLEEDEEQEWDDYSVCNGEHEYTICIGDEEFKVEPTATLIRHEGPIPSTAVQVHFGRYTNCLCPRGPLQKESMSLDIFQRLMACHEAWTDEKYGDNPSEQDLLGSLQSQAKEEFDAAIFEFAEQVGLA